jgi:DNA-binding transcriptional ArsR family regulator
LRFAFSPLWECIASLRVLAEPSAHPWHLGWLRQAQKALAGQDMALLFSLVRCAVGPGAKDYRAEPFERCEPAGIRNYIPDFLTPPPTTPFPDFETELALMLATPFDLVRRDIEKNFSDLAVVPDYASGFLADPASALAALAQTLRLYWHNTLALHWPRIRLLLEGDVMLRSRQLALSGGAGLFATLHHDLSYQAGILLRQSQRDIDIWLDGRGLLLVPSIFVGVSVMSTFAAPWQPMMIYPARGAADLWADSPLVPAEALAALLGAGAARVLLALAAPVGTVELAKRLGQSAGNISHHLARLEQAGLSEGIRQGRSVYYQRSVRAEGLLALYQG